MLKHPVSVSFLFLFLMITGWAWGQALPQDEQQFCSAFPVLREVLKQAHADSTGDSPRQQRQLRQAVSAAAKNFRRSAGWRSSNQAAKGWLGDLYSITESTAWGHHVGASVKLPCGDVIVGVPELAVRRLSVSSFDPVCGELSILAEPDAGVQTC